MPSWSSPPAPMIRLASPMRRLESQRMGGNRMSELTIGALRRAARSGCCTAQFFGTASKNTKMTTISNTMPSSTPRPPKRCSATMPTRVAETSWQISTRSRIGLRKLAGFSTSRASCRAPALLLVDQRLGLDPVHPHEAGLGHGQHTRGRQQRGDDDDEDDVLGVEPRRGQERDHAHASLLTRWKRVEQLLLQRLHALRLRLLLVVHAEQVEQPVDDQQRHLVLEGHPVLGRVARRHLGADHHVAEQGQRALFGRGARTAPAEVRRAPRGPRLVLDGEGQHVGRAGLAQELLVQRGHGVLVDEEQRDLGLPLDAPRRQDLAGQPRPASDVHGMDLLLVGGKDVNRHWVEPARPSATS